MDPNDQNTNPNDQSNDDRQKGPNYNPPKKGEPEPSGHLHGAEEDYMRKYMLSLTPEERQKAFEIEDERWSYDDQMKDWMKLGAMVIGTFIWGLILYFLVPGLR